MTKGKFVTFEGGEGGGKSTQASLLADRLRRIGLEVLLTREPGGTPRAENIREVLLSGKAKQFGALGEAVLFNAARESHLELAIRPALAAGTWVVCDRFSDSTRAYQGAAGGLPVAVIQGLEDAVVGDTRPDLTFIFDIAPEVGLRRAAVRRGTAEASAPDRFEGMNLAFHRNLREEFLAIAKAEPERCVLIDAAEPRDRIAEQIWTVVRERLNV